MNVTLSSCGRRVELVRLFKDALKRLGGGLLVGTDMSPLASALWEVDRPYLVPPCREEGFIEALIRICRKEGARAIIPLIDTELGILARSRELLMGEDIFAVVSDWEVIDVCEDKLKTAEFFERGGLPCLKTREAHEALDGEWHEYPAVLKPRRGSGSKDVFVVNNEDEARILAGRIDEPILQEMASGMEITADCLVDMEGEPIRIVTRERLETRAGESSKGRTFKDPSLTELLREMLLMLGARGPVTVQCFRGSGGYILTEINPRFGGGYPLAHAAGADYPFLLLRMLVGERVEVGLEEYEEDLYMTRYDQSFFLRHEDISRKFGAEKMSGEA